MNLKKLILTNNDCYKKATKIKVKGIMVHSTGVNNTKLSRYVGPDDGLLGRNPNNNHWNRSKPDGRQVCVHAFIGKLKDGTIATYQTLPWDYKGWHSGGSANNSYIGFEICEDDLTHEDYFNLVYKEAAELCAYLCRKFNLKSSDIICHCEGHELGVASDHGDVMHWFPRFNKSMTTFREDVSKLLNSNKYVVVTKINGYKNSSDAINKVNPIRTINQGSYYIFNKYPNGYKGMYNITNDKSGDTAGSWINPIENDID